MHKYTMIMKEDYSFEELHLNEEIVRVLDCIDGRFDDYDIENIKTVDAYFSELKKMLSGVVVKRTVKQEVMLLQMNRLMYDESGSGRLYDYDLMKLQLDIEPINVELNRLLGSRLYNEFFTYVETTESDFEKMSTTISNTIMTVADAKYYEEKVKISSGEEHEDKRPMPELPNDW